MQTLLRATPDDLPALLAAAGVTETPHIDDDPDPDIGLSWDGQRNSRHYTAVVSHPDTDACRADDHTIELATSRVILSFAKAMLDFSGGNP